MPESNGLLLSGTDLESGVVQTESGRDEDDEEDSPSVEREEQKVDGGRIVS